MLGRAALNSSNQVVGTLVTVHFLGRDSVDGRELPRSPCISSEKWEKKIGTIIFIFI